MSWPFSSRCNVCWAEVPVSTAMASRLGLTANLCKPCAERARGKAKEKAKRVAEEKRRDAEIKVMHRQAAEAEAKRVAEAERLEAEAIAKGELLPRPSKAVAVGEPSKGTFRAAGLTWQRQPAPRALKCNEARSYAAKLTLAGGGWQLPTVHELDALYKAKLSSPALAAHPGMDAGWYWSSSPFPEGNTWSFNFSEGSTAGNVNDEPIAVRCVVRDSETTEALRVTKQAGGPLRNGSGAGAAGEPSEGTFRAADLTWQREPAPWEMSLEDAKSYAARLTLAGGGWRLPTLSELEALYEAKLSSPVIAAYAGMDKGLYLSTSPCESHPTEFTWGVDFAPKRSGPWGSSSGGGQVRGVADSRIGSVRCVRP